MATDFSSALRAEIAELEAALENDLRYKRLRELRRVLSLYPTDPLPASISMTTADFLKPVKPPGFYGGGNVTFVTRSAGGRRISPERAKAVEVARLFLANRVSPTPTREIYDHLVSLGVTVPGEVPVNNLSAMLSNSEEFLSHGRSGWTLRGKDDAIPDTLFRDTCEIVLADLDNERLREIYAGIVNKEGIPSDLDGQLLASVRSDIRRDLTENEKRDLRMTFRDMVEASLTESDRAAIEGRDYE